MDLKRIRELLQIVAESEVNEIEIEESDFKLTIRKNAPTMIMQQAPYMPPVAPPMYQAFAPTAPVIDGSQGVASPAPTTVQSSEPPAQTEATAAAPANEFVVRAPIVGTFYRSPSPEADAYVQVGDTIAVGTVVCIIEAMKLMNEIESEVNGKITRILVENEQPVEYDQPLFVVEKT